MARRLFALATAVALMSVPSLVMADPAAPSATGMKGSPNANRYGDERGMDKSAASKSAPNEKASSERPAAAEVPGTKK